MDFIDDTTGVIFTAIPRSYTTKTASTTQTCVKRNYNVSKRETKNVKSTAARETKSLLSRFWHSLRRFFTFFIVKNKRVVVPTTSVEYSNNNETEDEDSQSDGGPHLTHRRKGFGFEERNRPCYNSTLPYSSSPSTGQHELHELPYVPIEIQMEIIRKSPKHLLYTYRQICHEWNSIVLALLQNHNVQMQSHLNRSKITAFRNIQTLIPESETFHGQVFLPVNGYKVSAIKDLVSKKHFGRLSPPSSLSLEGPLASENFRTIMNLWAKTLTSLTLTTGAMESRHLLHQKWNLDFSNLTSLSFILKPNLDRSPGRVFQRLPPSHPIWLKRVCNNFVRISKANFPSLRKFKFVFTEFEVLYQQFQCYFLCVALTLIGKHIWSIHDVEVVFHTTGNPTNQRHYHIMDSVARSLLNFHLRKLTRETLMNVKWAQVNRCVFHVGTPSSCTSDDTVCNLITDLYSAQMSLETFVLESRFGISLQKFQSICRHNSRFLQRIDVTLIPVQIVDLAFFSEYPYLQYLRLLVSSDPNHRERDPNTSRNVISRLEMSKWNSLPEKLSFLSFYGFAIELELLEYILTSLPNLIYLSLQEVVTLTSYAEFATSTFLNEVLSHSCLKVITLGSMKWPSETLADMFLCLEDLGYLYLKDLRTKLETEGWSFHWTFWDKIDKVNETSDDDIPSPRGFTLSKSKDLTFRFTEQDAFGLPYFRK